MQWQNHFNAQPLVVYCLNKLQISGSAFRWRGTSAEIKAIFIWQSISVLFSGCEEALYIDCVHIHSCLIVWTVSLNFNCRALLAQNLFSLAPNPAPLPPKTTLSPTSHGTARSHLNTAKSHERIRPREVCFLWQTTLHRWRVFIKACNLDTFQITSILSGEKHTNYASVLRRTGNTITHLPSGACAQWFVGQGDAGPFHHNERMSCMANVLIVIINTTSLSCCC